MRLAKVDSGHGLRYRLLLKLIRMITGVEPVDVLKALMYRPELFGRPFASWLQAIMRGPSSWSVGERELFAAFTSKLNECKF